MSSSAKTCQMGDNGAIVIIRATTRLDWRAVGSTESLILYWVSLPLELWCWYFLARVSISFKCSILSAILVAPPLIIEINLAVAMIVSVTPYFLLDTAARILGADEKYEFIFVLVSCSLNLIHDLTNRCVFKLSFFRFVFSSFAHLYACSWSIW